MNKHSMIFIGLDTHKEFHEVAYCGTAWGESGSLWPYLFFQSQCQKAVTSV